MDSPASGRVPRVWGSSSGGGDPDDRCDDPIDDEAKGRPPPGISNVSASMLPQVLDPCRIADHKEPGRSADRRSGE